LEGVEVVGKRLLIGISVTGWILIYIGFPSEMIDESISALFDLLSAGFSQGDVPFLFIACSCFSLRDIIS
jgi:hypothetical protein